MTAFNVFICYNLKSFKFFEILGFDMWYQSMVQTLGLDVAQLLSAEQLKIKIHIYIYKILTRILFYV